MQIGHISIHILSLNRIEMNLVGEPGPWTSKRASFLIYWYIFVCCPKNQLLCHQVTKITMQVVQIAIHTPSLIRIERFRMAAMTSNFENFYFLIEIHCTSMYICLLPQNQLLCLEHRKFLLSYRNPLFIDVYLSVATKPPLVPASHYSQYI